MKNIAPIRSPDEPARMPRSLKQFLRNLTQQYPSNLLLFNVALTPMEPSEWCLIWVPRIYPEVSAPLPGERKPLGYLAACQDILCFLTGYSDKTIQRWLDGDDCKLLVKHYLRLIHIFWTLQRFLQIPLALIRNLETGKL